MLRRSFQLVTVLTLATIIPANAVVTRAQAPSAAPLPALTVQQIVEKHLDSIGPAAARAKVTTRQIVAVCNTEAKVESRVVMFGSGMGYLFSVGRNLLFGANFQSRSFPEEWLGYDGNKLTTGYLAPQQRTPLGEFLLSDPVGFEEGLITGALSSAWPLEDIKIRATQLLSSGTKKLGEREAYVLKYLPRRPSNYSIRLFFDTESFHHVRTEYERTVAPGPTTTGSRNSGPAREFREALVEEFSEFRIENGLVLPHFYALKMSLGSEQGTAIQTVDFALATFTFNKKIDKSLFNLENRKK